MLQSHSRPAMALMTRTLVVLLLAISTVGAACVVDDDEGGGGGGGGGATPVPTTASPVEHGKVTLAFDEAKVDGQPADIDTAIYQGSTLTTGDPGTMRFETPDFSWCQSSKATELVVRPDSKTALRLVTQQGANGETMCATKNAASVEILPPGTQIEISGTVFTVVLGDGGHAVRVLEGSVRVTGGGTTVELPQNFATVIAASGVPSVPVAFTTLSTFELQSVLASNLALPLFGSTALDVIESLEAPDDTSWTVTLKDRRFADGSAVTASSLAAIFEQNSELFSGLVGVEVIDDGVLRLEARFIERGDLIDELQSVNLNLLDVAE